MGETVLEILHSLLHSHDGGIVTGFHFATGRQNKEITSVPIATYQVFKHSHGPLHGLEPPAVFSGFLAGEFFKARVRFQSDFDKGELLVDVAIGVQLLEKVGTLVLAITLD